MTPHEDAEYLGRYVSTGSEDAFAALVQRYLPLVYSAALRRVAGDVHCAQDVAQTVFAALARNAAALTKHPDLTGWLFTTTRFLAAKTVRSEQRRRAREQHASLTHEAMSENTSDATTASLQPVLDDVLMELRQLDRQMILLRFHRGLRLAEIGTRLGATENAVQKRLDRALDQLKDKLARRGITSTAAALAVAFEQQSAVAMPAGLAASATVAGLACGSTTGSLLAVSTLMTISKVQLGLAAAVVVATSGGLVWQTRENAALCTELADQIAATEASAAALSGKIAILGQRAEAAEADAARLQKAIQAANVAPPAPAPTRVLTDADAEAQAAMDRAGQLRREGKPREALDEYLRIYRLQQGRRGTYPQLIMTALKSFGAQFPPALEALRELRDAAMEKLRSNPPDARELVSEIGQLNERLGDGRASMALYDTLPAGDPGRQALGLIARNSFVEARRYADAMVGTPFGAMLNELDMHVRFSAREKGTGAETYRGYVVKRVGDSIEVLTGAGKLDEARTLTEKLLAFDNSKATRAAIQQHVARATQAPAP